MNDGQFGMACPQCGSAAAVHSVQELAAMARSQLGGPQGNAGPQPGYGAQPQQGTVPGWAAEPRPISEGRSQGSGPGRSPRLSSGSSSSLEDDLASMAIGAAAGFIGRAIGRRLQRAVTEQVVPAMAAKRDAMLREQIAIAERHPDLCACLNDQVIFLAGGTRVLPLPNLAQVTVEQADAIVAQLRNG